jgi:hypothetical protein
MVGGPQLQVSKIQKRMIIGFLPKLNLFNTYKRNLNIFVPLVYLYL